MKSPSVALVAATLLASQESSAFAPVRPVGTTTSTPATTAGMTSTSLQAQSNLFDRFFRVTRANLNQVLQQFEDPTKVMGQALEDMQGDLVRVRQTYAEVTATQRRMAHQKTQLEATADDWHRRAQLALRSSNEGLAREALARRQQLLDQAATVQQQIDSQSANVDKLYEGMLALEKKIVEAKSKQNEMAARANTAKWTMKVNDMLSGLTGKTSMDAFNRMEEKVLALEAAAEVSYEMGNTMLGRSLPAADGTSGKMDIEKEFRLLEASSSVDKELEALKKKILPPGTTISATTKRTIPIETAKQSEKELQLN